MFQNLWANVSRNWQTSLVGFIVLIGMALKILFPGNETTIDALIKDVPTAITNLIGFATGVGLLFAKDSSITGTAANPRAINAGDADPGPVVPKVPVQ